MKLCASLITRNELGRYLPVVVEHLLAFCDELRVLDDRSDDGTYEWLRERDERVVVKRNDGPAFFEHEGRARNELLRFTLEGRPSHVLAIDSDELVSDGQKLRQALATLTPRVRIFRLGLVEVWRAERDSLALRSDGGWRRREVPILWRPTMGAAGRNLRIQDRALACGREPEYVRRRAYARASSTALGVDLLHFGWANEAERVARHARYAEHDGGNFHASAHLDSILWSNDQVRLAPYAWPAGLVSYRDALLAIANAPAKAAA